MNELGSGRTKPWNIYTSADPSPSQPGGADKEDLSKKLGTSMDAISFGFVATAILISLFLIMAIFEHLFRASSSFSSPQEGAEGSLESGSARHRMNMLKKLGNSQMVSTPYSSDFLVLMPGQYCPTFIAQPAPLPCQREGICWPPHEQGFVFP